MFVCAHPESLARMCSRWTRWADACFLIGTWARVDSIACWCHGKNSQRGLLITFSIRIHNWKVRRLLHAAHCWLPSREPLPDSLPTIKIQNCGTLDFRFLTSDCGLRTSDFGFETSDFRFQPSEIRDYKHFRHFRRFGHFRFQTPDVRPRNSDLRLQTSDFRLRTSHFRPRSSDFRLQISDVRLQTSDLGVQIS